MIITELNEIENLIPKCEKFYSETCYYNSEAYYQEFKARNQWICAVAVEVEPFEHDAEFKDRRTLFDWYCKVDEEIEEALKPLTIAAYPPVEMHMMFGGNWDLLAKTIKNGYLTEWSLDSALSTFPNCRKIRWREEFILGWQTEIKGFYILMLFGYDNIPVIIQPQIIK